MDFMSKSFKNTFNIISFSKHLPRHRSTRHLVIQPFQECLLNLFHIYLVCHILLLIIGQ